ncbi:MAG TPA: hypothetical protein VF588_22550 [Pyrinomonadaceae bacterium]
MTIIDPVELFFAGEDGETITVVVKSVNTRHAVNAILDGGPAAMTSTAAQASSVSFKLDMAQNDPSHLLLFFQFFNNMGGGLYKVIIRGDRGPTSFGMLVQQFNLKATAKIYSFDVV